MNSTRLWLAALLATAITAVGCPAAFASSGHDGIKWASVRGVLNGYTAGYTATIGVTGGTRQARRAAHVPLKVGLSLTTKVQFGSSKKAAPLVTAGDGVLVKLKWTNRHATAVAMTYLPKGSIPSTTSGSGQNELGTSTFHGSYILASSTAAVLAITTNYGATAHFDLTPDTVYYEGGVALASPSLSDGEHLAVQGTQQSDGSWAANTVVVGDHKGDSGAVGQAQFFSGFYKSSNSGTMTMSSKAGGVDQTFSIGPKTKLFDASGNQITTLNYYAGEVCHVMAVQQPDGTWLARRIRAGSDKGSGDNQIFKGAYVSSSSTALTVADGFGNNETFTVNGNTLYFDKHGNPVASLPYVAGEKLWITGSRQPDGTWLATEVSLSHPNDGHEGSATQNFDGLYLSDTPNSLDLQLSGGDCQSFTVSSSTLYFDQSGNPVSSLTYTASEPLHVVATEPDDGGWVATEVIAGVQSNAKGADDSGGCDD